MSAYEFSMDQFVCYDREKLNTFFSNRNVHKQMLNKCVSDYDGQTPNDNDTCFTKVDSTQDGNFDTIYDKNDTKYEDYSFENINQVYPSSPTITYKQIKDKIEEEERERERERDKYPEIFKNCDYKDKYTTLSAQDKYYHDTKANYDRTWRQAANLSLGICLLFVGIYYQN